MLQYGLFLNSAEYTSLFLAAKHALLVCVKKMKSSLYFFGQSHFQYRNKFFFCFWWVSKNLIRCKHFHYKCISRRKTIKNKVFLSTTSIPFYHLNWNFVLEKKKKKHNYGLCVTWKSIKLRKWCESNGPKQIMNIYGGIDKNRINIQMIAQVFVYNNYTFSTWTMHLFDESLIERGLLVI